MDNRIYQTYLLEWIAYKMSPGNKEFSDWQVSFRKLTEEAEERYAATAKAEVPKETNQPQPPAAGGGALEGVRNTYGGKNAFYNYLEKREHSRLELKKPDDEKTK